MEKKRDCMEHEEYPKVYLYRRVVRAKLYIDENYVNAIDLDSISGEAHFSKFHFIRLFKKTYGQTPNQYLKTVRVQQAKELLKTHMKVAEVCYAVGFGSVSSFAGLFKRAVGIPPSVYQLEQQKMRSDIKEKPLRFVPSCFAEAKGWT